MKRGYVLIVVLWSVVAMGTLTAGVLLVARQAVATTGNRIALGRARWRAEGCASSALSRIELALRQSETSESAWAAVDSIELVVPGCSFDVRAFGSTLDVNRASEIGLYRLAHTAGLGVARAESLAAAIVDWRDADDDPRPSGAERDWYRAAERISPSNAPFQDITELLSVRGSDWLPGLDTVLSTESDPVLLTRAPAPVLAALPYIGSEAIEAIIGARREKPHPGLPFISERLSPRARAQLIAGLQTLLEITTKEPQGWTLHASSRDPTGVEASIELRIARDGSRAAILRRRSWP